MKIKKNLIIICLIFCVLFSISSVTASDVNETAIANEDEQIIEETNADEILETDDGTFTALQEKINNVASGSTITLENDYSYDAKFNSSVEINKPLVINGNNHVIDGLYSSRLFIVSSENVTLKNLQFVNGNFSTGGAIYSSGENMVIDNCKFINNNANYGGALCINKNTIVKNSLFEDNAASVGGAICIESNGKTNLTIDNTVFNKNSAIAGGAIYSPCGYATTFDIYDRGAYAYTRINRFPNQIKITGNSKFTNNVAEDAGGAIMMLLTVQSALNYDVNGIIIVEQGVIFENNVAEWGGALTLQNVKSTFTGAIFKNNKASSTRGGAIYTSYFSNMLIDSSTFADNVAEQSGGSIYAENNLNVTNSKFTSTNNIDFINYYVEANGDFPNGKLYVDNNQMTGSNDYDIWFEGNLPMEFKTFLIFENKTISPNTSVNLGELHDANGNSIRVSEIGVILTKVGDSQIADSTILQFNENNAGYTYDCKLSQGVYRVTGEISSDIASNCEVIEGDLTISKVNIKASDVIKNYGGSENLDITLSDNGKPVSNAKININLNGKTYSRTTDSNGKTSLSLDLNAGTYDAVVSYDDVSTTVKITVNQLTTKTSLTASQSGESVVLTASITPGSATGTVTFSINGATYLSNVNNGKASITVSGLGEGSYPASATYNGDTNYKTSSATASVKVDKFSTIIVGDSEGTTLNPNIRATFFDNNGKTLANTKVTFKVHYKFNSINVDSFHYFTTDENGVATFNEKLDYGSHNVTAVNPVTNEEKHFKVKISKVDSDITLSVDKSGNSVTLTAALAASSGQVSFYINPKNYTSEIKNGKATLILSDLSAGSYSAYAHFSGNSYYEASNSNNVTFNIENVYPVLTVKDLIKTYGTSNKLIINLVDSKGNAIANANVNVNINNQITPVVTDARGQAAMPINLAPATYTATVTYADTQAVAKIKVEKATPKLTAKAKTFKRTDKTKKYTITLKNNQNKVMKNTKITLKVNGKTYSTKTNTKGVATFKLTKLTKKGKFTATVKYAGSSYYYAKTVKPKITVK